MMLQTPAPAPSLGRLGYNPQIGSNGQVVDCDSFWGLFNGVCWNPTAPGVPVKVQTDPVTGQQSLVPDLQGAADAQNSPSNQPLLSGLSDTAKTVLIAGAVVLGTVLVVSLRR